ncbi:hypothetical protein ACSSS7_001669 [Eimeria intestinalis]
MRRSADRQQQQQPQQQRLLRPGGTPWSCCLLLLLLLLLLMFGASLKPCCAAAATEDPSYQKAAAGPAGAAAAAASPTAAATAPHVPEEAAPPAPTATPAAPPAAPAPAAPAPAAAAAVAATAAAPAAAGAAGPEPAAPSPAAPAPAGPAQAAPAAAPAAATAPAAAAAKLKDPDADAAEAEEAPKKLSRGVNLRDILRLTRSLNRLNPSLAGGAASPAAAAARAAAATFSVAEAGVEAASAPTDPYSKRLLTLPISDPNGSSSSSSSSEEENCRKLLGLLDGPIMPMTFGMRKEWLGAPEAASRVHRFSLRLLDLGPLTTKHPLHLQPQLDADAPVTLRVVLMTKTGDFLACNVLRDVTAASSVFTYISVQEARDLVGAAADSSGSSSSSTSDNLYLLLASDAASKPNVSVRLNEFAAGDVEPNEIQCAREDRGGPLACEAVTGRPSRRYPSHFLYRCSNNNGCFEGLQPKDDDILELTLSPKLQGAVSESSEGPPPFLLLAAWGCMPQTPSDGSDEGEGPEGAHEGAPKGSQNNETPETPEGAPPLCQTIDRQGWIKDTVYLSVQAHGEPPYISCCSATKQERPDPAFGLCCCHPTIAALKALSPSGAPNNSSSSSSSCLWLLLECCVDVISVKEQPDCWRASEAEWNGLVVLRSSRQDPRLFGGLEIDGVAIVSLIPFSQSCHYEHVAFTTDGSRAPLTLRITKQQGPLPSQTCVFPCQSAKTPLSTCSGLPVPGETPPGSLCVEAQHEEDQVQLLPLPDLLPDHHYVVRFQVSQWKTST